jgi:type II secretory pathway pseudopilin PulG
VTRWGWLGARGDLTASFYFLGLRERRMSIRPLRPYSVKTPSEKTRARPAFSIVEATVAIAITALAVAALATVTTSSLLATNDAVANTIADGIAQQLLDEVMLEKYAVDSASALSLAFGPNSAEQAGAGRSLYDDTDDFYNLSKAPPQGIYGEELGRGNDAGSLRDPAFAIPTGYFGKFRERTRVYFVSPNDLTTEITAYGTSYRCCEAIVEQLRSDGSWVPLASRRRVFSYVPSNL